MIITSRAPGPRGTAQTVAAIIAFAASPYHTRQIRLIALEITAGTSGDAANAQRIFEWVTRHVKYTRDAIGREHVQDPLWLLTAAREGSPYAAGDCDCHAALVLALLMSLGIRGRLALNERVDARGGRQPIWSHIWTEALIPTARQKKVVKTPAGPVLVSPREWVALDSSMARHKNIEMGRRPPGRLTFVHPEDITENRAWEKAQRAATAGQNSGKYNDAHLGLAAEVIKAGTGLIQGAMASRTAEKLAKLQARADHNRLQAEERLTAEELRLAAALKEAQGQQTSRYLAQERAFDRVSQEADHFARRPVKVALGVGAVALLATLYMRR